MLMMLLVALVAAVTGTLVAYREARQSDRRFKIDNEISALEDEKWKNSPQRILELDAEILELKKEKDRLVML